MAINYETGNGSITNVKRLTAGGVNDLYAVVIDETNMDTNLCSELVPTFEKKIEQLRREALMLLTTFESVAGSLKSIDEEVKGKKIINVTSSGLTFQTR